MEAHEIDRSGTFVVLISPLQVLLIEIGHLKEALLKLGHAVLAERHRGALRVFRWSASERRWRCNR